MTTFIPYSGNSDYCYPNSLRMSLQAAGMDPHILPDAGFLECLTTLPFGKLYLKLEDGPIALFSSSEADPDLGLTLALKALGWTCHERRGQEPEEALASLREAVHEAPVLIGPVDLGYLSYNPLHNDLAGGDHFVVALAITDDSIMLHDPWKFPCVSLPIAEFMQAWRAERIGYLQAPYTFRAGFRQVEQVSREETIARTIGVAQANLRAEQNGPVVYSGAHALRMLAADLRAPQPPVSITASLATFTLPLGARRAIDAAAFLREAGLPEAAHCMEQQALLCGQAQYLATHQHYEQIAELLERLAKVEQEITERLLHATV
jgi:hypothetical protein